ncbi:hypothetical protein EVJ58_g8969 [Rhodofomes roseus]|uniref:F-box domain-containing protein n=1 Tax=Rhodofomes roseus TaxID=34475 RepID=A0A4Y9XVG6_9APHY|nr:hypothetical protein EVJ58_g8969 [Rhodofomes roseus]
MDDPVNKAERVEDQIADPESIPDKLTGEDHGKEEKDSGSEYQWGWIPIPFRQPIYSSDTGPRLPQELIERICEFLWDEPVQLAVSCTRICPAWYHAARRLLPERVIACQTREALQDHAHTLTSHRNAPYRKRFQQLRIYDNASKPFAHVWPMLIPGSMLPELWSVHLGNLDWSVKIPHDSFFVYLSSYTSISHLQLRNCRFRSPPGLRRVINALPNLMSLELYNITLQHPLRPGSVPDYITLRARSHRLESIDLRGSEHGPKYRDVSLDYQEMTALDHQALLRMVAANSFIVTTLVLDLRFFTSHSALRQWLAHFCRLTTFIAQNQFASGPVLTFEETIPQRTENTYEHPWSAFVLRSVSDQTALQLLQLLNTPDTCSKLEELDIYLTGRPSATLLSCTSRVLHALGHRLRILVWMCSADPDVEATPSLAGNMSLQRVYISLRDVAPSPQKIHSALTAVLSDIVSVDLQHVSIWFTLAHLEPEVLPQNHGRTPVAPDLAESISAFHAILSREIFKEILLRTDDKCDVIVTFYAQNMNNPTVVANIKAYMVNLFTPWLDRGIVSLDFYLVEGVETITRVPTSMLSEDTLSDRGGEDVEENTPVGTEQ